MKMMIVKKLMNFSLLVFLTSVMLVILLLASLMFLHLFFCVVSVSHCYISIWGKVPVCWILKHTTRIFFFLAMSK